MDNKSTITIDDLPFELFELIVDQLKLKDKLKLPLVSKLWYNRFIHLKKITKLYISEESKNYIPNRYHLNRTEFNKHFLKINFNKFNRFFILFKSTKLSELKDLRIFNFKCSTNFISTLNSIQSLENLLIFGIESLNGSITISLPILRSFTIEYLKIDKLSLNTPKLKCFKINYNLLRISDSYEKFLIHFQYPDSLEFIQIDEYRTGYKKFLNLNEFTNLKKLVIRSFNDVLRNLLLNLNQLEELHISAHVDNLMKIYNQKLKLNRTNLRIYYCGLLIENLDDYNKWFKNRNLNLLTLDYDLVSLYLDNYSKLSNEIILHGVIDYSSFEHSNFNVDLWSKFKNLNTFNINFPIKYEERFLELSKIKLMANIECLNISINSNSINLLDKLDLVIPFVKRINIDISDGERNLTGDNFKFLFKFKYLIDIRVNLELDYNFLIEFYQNLKYFKSLEFCIKSHIIEISKLNNNSFNLYFKRIELSFNSINNLLEFLKDENLL